MIVYVKHQGAVISRKGNTLQVKKDDTLSQTIFVHRLQTLVLMGGVSLTIPAINLLCREKIDTVFLTINGRYKGRLETEESKNVFLTKKQFASIDNHAFSLGIAQSIVAGKLGNMATLLGRIKRRNKKKDASLFESQIAVIRNCLANVSEAASIEALHGYEGAATAAFFKGFRHGFKNDWNFKKRIRRPPTDPVNSILSFLYTLLFNRIYAALRVVGLNPAVGYLHSLDYGRYSLALDLMEEFRSIVVETCTLSLFNLGILKEESFYYEEAPRNEAEVMTHPSVASDAIGHIFENPDDGYFDAAEQKVEEKSELDHTPNEKRPCRLRPEALKVVLESFEEKLQTEFHYALTDTRMTYAEAFVAQCRQFRECLEGNRASYQSLMMR